jgi:hypothetical protein
MGTSINTKFVNEQRAFSSSFDLGFFVVFVFVGSKGQCTCSVNIMRSESIDH